MRAWIGVGLIVLGAAAPLGASTGGIVLRNAGATPVTLEVQLPREATCGETGAPVLLQVLKPGRAWRVSGTGLICWRLENAAWQQVQATASFPEIAIP